MTYTVIAYRGNASEYRENTLAAFQSAVDLGCKQIELDVQMTFDLVPIVYHDATLLRVHGRDFDVRELTLVQVKAFAPDIPTLDEVTQWMKCLQDVSLFVNLKEESINVFGRDAIINRVLSTVKSIQERVILISFDLEIVSLVRRFRPDVHIGWVVPNMQSSTIDDLNWLKPQFVFIDVNSIPQGGNMPNNVDNPWKWVAYEVTDRDIAADLFPRGIGSVGTMQVQKMICT